MHYIASTQRPEMKNTYKNEINKLTLRYYEII